MAVSSATANGYHGDASTIVIGLGVELDHR